MPERDARAFLRQAGWGTAKMTPLAGDASTRRYARLAMGGRRALLMDQPQGAETPGAGRDASEEARRALGYNAQARLAHIGLVNFLSIALNVADGARSVSADYLEVARAFRAPRLRTVFEVVLLASVPYLLAGLRLAAGRALTGAVIADFYLAIPGLGYYILYNSRSFHHNEALVAVLVLVAGGVGFDRLVNWGSRRLLPWLRRD